MKRALLGLSLALAFAGTAARGATVVSGPIVNPANNHTYYLLSADTWTNSEAFAQTLGGHLVTINDAAENTFVYQNFAQGRNVWIGYNDQQTEGTFVWASGENPLYTNWRPGQPDNFSTSPVNGEDYVHMYGSQVVVNQVNLGGLWNDSANDTSVYSSFSFANEVGQIQGVVEVVPLPPAAYAGAALLGGMAILRARRRKLPA